MLPNRLRFWTLFSLVAGSNVCDFMMNQTLSLLSSKSKASVFKGFEAMFSDMCDSITEETEISGTCVLLDSIEVVSQASGADCLEIVNSLPQEWFDSGEVVRKVVALRRSNAIDDQTRKNAKELTIFLCQVEFGGFKVENNFMHVCLEYIVRAAPVNKFYEILLESRLTNLTGAQKATVLNTLLENFDPDECRFFSAIVVTELDGFGTPFFAAWYQKLSDCNFEGREISRHLAKLTSSLLASKLAHTEEYYALLRLCLRRVSIPLVMSFDRFHRLYYRTLQILPISTLECLMDRFLDVSVIENVPEKLRIAHGQFLSIFSKRHSDYAVSQSARAIPFDSAATLSALLSEAQTANTFCTNQTSFITSLDSPIRAWSLGKLQRAADGLAYIAKAFRGVLEMDMKLSQDITKVVLRLHADFNANFAVPSSDRLVAYTRLLFSVLHAKSLMIHVTARFGNECIDSLNSFNTQLWPIIKLDAEKAQEVRKIYSAALASIEFIAKNSLFTDSVLAVEVMHDVIFNLSDSPAKDLNFIIQLAWKTDDSFFYFALEALPGRPGFDEPLFHCYLLEKLAHLDTSDNIDRMLMNKQVTSFIKKAKSISLTAIDILKIFSSEFLK